MIRNSEDANKYYQIVNQYVDDYIEEFIKKHKFKPSRVESYLLENKAKLKNFISRRGLSDVNGIEQVLSDILQDRVSMRKDSVMTFENFKFLDSDDFKILDLKQCLYKGIDNVTINHEKILADYYDVSLSQIDVVSAEKHIFKIDELNIVIYNEDELNIIKENIKDYVLNQTFSKNIKLDLGSSDLDLNVNVKDFMDTEKFNNKIEEILTKENVKNITSSILGCKLCDDEENFIATFM